MIFLDKNKIYLKCIYTYLKTFPERGKKKLNELKNRVEYRTGKIILDSYPYIYMLGLTNVCNLSCRLCPTGQRRQTKPPQFMEFDLFKQVIEKIKGIAQKVVLHNWGESLLHKEFNNILEYCNRYNLNTELSSNLSLENVDDKLEAMVRYSLKHLIVSFDGITQKDYERYRVGGRLDTVLDNIRKLERLKKKNGSRFPIISLQFLKNMYTGNQIEMIENNYKEWGADKYIVYDMKFTFLNKTNEKKEDWFEDDWIQNRKYLDVDLCLQNKRCIFLYSMMVIDQDGLIQPCCFTPYAEDYFDKWDNEKTILQMYNSELFVNARNLFKKKNSKHTLVCHHCTVLKTWRENDKSNYFRF